MKKRKNNLGRGNLIAMLFILIGLMVFVIATAPVWVGSGVDYHANEDSPYTHNLSVNITGFNNDVSFAIDTETNVNWTNISGSYLVTASSISSWIYISNASLGDLIINATNDSQTGFFIIPIQATNTTDDEFTGTNFEFRVNATNDIPVFTLDNNHSVSVTDDQNASLNISLVGTDEEGQYPLSYNVSFNDCSFAIWSDRNNTNCSLNYEMISISNTTSTFALKDMTYNDVGTYNLTVCVWDDINGSALPLYYDSNYVENKSYCLNRTFEIKASLIINASDCEGRNWTEGNTLNCVINITTIAATDEVELVSYASFINDGGAPYNISWFYPFNTINATDFLISLNITIPSLSKRHVGNWSINFSADDASLTEIPRPVYETILFFVNYTESSVSLASISDLTGNDALYLNYSFQINATDDDLLIWDDSIKKETFTFASNVSWVTISNSNAGDSLYNYRLGDVTVDHGYALANFGEGNYSVLINVTDGASNLDSDIFTIEILNDTAPEWDAGLSDPVNLELTENVSFYYNVTVNVTDIDNDPISFYYNNISAPFCSLTPGNFSSSTGIIDFTPLDCDVGYHNVTIIASDGKLNSSYSFNFTVANTNDAPSIITALGNQTATEAVSKTINLQIEDFDYLIPAGQSSFYDENLTINLTITNITAVVTPISFNFVGGVFAAELELFNATFTPDEDNVGIYNITINVSDVSGLYDVSYFVLNISRVNDNPNLTFIENQTTTSKRIFYLDVNATDEEDSPSLPESGVLNYTLNNLTVGGNFLIINLTTGIINVTMNESIAGFYEYNLSVIDSEGGIDWQIFSLSIHGTPNITIPNSSYIFDWDEYTQEQNLEFEVDYAVNNTNLTYSFYLDRIVYSNLTEYNYTNLSDELRNSTNYTWVDNNNYTWNFTPDYRDETYGLLKNFTLIVFNPEFPELNISKNWKVNVTHTNENISFSGTIPDKGPITIGSSVDVNLSEYFSDADYSDKAINQNINFSIVTKAGDTNNIATSSSFNGWILSLSSSVAATETISIVAYEYNSSNISIGNATSNEFEVEFIPPAVVEVPRSSSSTRTVLKHFSLKLIVPQDIILSDQNYIEVPFSLQNTGDIDLTGINLWSEVRYNNAFSDDIKILLEESYIQSLKIGQTENYTLRVYADTQRSGKYKISVFANVTSPKFSDWGDFFIDLKRVNESEAEQILLFVEQFITDNPECLELTEVFARAEEAFGSGDVYTALELAEEVTVACEDTIRANEQIRYSAKSFVERNFYYISFITLGIFFIGLIFYIYKRVRFNKYEEDYNI